MPGQAVVKHVEQQLALLREKAPGELSRLPEYSEIMVKVDGKRHWLGVWREKMPDGKTLIVAQCRDPRGEAGERSCVKGFYLDEKSDYPMASDEDLKSYA